MSTIEAPRSETGIIIRDERLYHAERDGNLEFWVPDNEWVRVNTHIASIQDPYVVQAASSELSNVEAAAISLQAIRPFTEAENFVQRLNNNMGRIVNSRMHSFTVLNMSDIYTLRDDLNREINTRNQISINDSVTARGSLAREQERHTAILGAHTRNMYAGESGIMSRLIDGWETELTVDSIGIITGDDVRRVADYDIIAPNQVVQEGDPIFKIVGNVWHIAAYMPNDMINDFTEGTNRTVYLLNATTGGYEPHSLRIRRIEYGTRYSLVVFRNTRHAADFINQRSVSIRTTSGIERGLKIPDTAIVTSRHYRIPHGFIHGEHMHHVLLSTEAGNITVPITIDEVTEDYVFVPITYDLAVDSILVPNDPDNFHMLLSQDHVRVRHGVYRVILGSAEFREVNLGENGATAGYILLDPALNPWVAEFSEIVTDASTVVAGQLVR